MLVELISGKWPIFRKILFRNFDMNLLNTKRRGFKILFCEVTELSIRCVCLSFYRLVIFLRSEFHPSLVQVRGSFYAREH